MWFYLTAVLLYLVALAVMGVWWARSSSNSSDDFMVAGRALPARVLVFTLLSTWIGSGSLFAGAGLGYRVGLPALWQSAGAWVGIAVIFFLAPRVRRLAQFTVPDILELRYGRAARLLGTITIVFAYTAIAAYQFRGGGRLLHLVSGLNPATGAAITAAFCVLFTAAAGMRSIARLDVVNGLMMLGGIGIALVYVLGRAGGVAPALASVRPDQVTVFGALAPHQALGLFLPTLCLLLGEANMYQKFFSARDERAARRSVAGWIVGTIVVESMIVALGLLGSAQIPGLGVADSEAIVVRLAVDVLPSIIGALLLAGCAAIIVSTASSMLLSPATNLVARCLSALHQPCRPRQPHRLRHPHRHRRARRHRAGRQQLLPDRALDGALGLHHVWRRHHARADRRAGLARRDTPRRDLVDRRGHVDHPAVGARRPGARERGRAALSARDPDDLPGVGCIRGRADRADAHERAPQSRLSLFGRVSAVTLPSCPRRLRRAGASAFADATADKSRQDETTTRRSRRKKNLCESLRRTLPANGESH